ncbi:uncharacterized protein LOC130291226 [Hyla sarda]|uniref:uncharacterized protein LOC130291226 n=1 Tax=Hyla sarda TaxID=327740 RepID=UPI0024C228D0|nr:uncharacterized protein LOC130291226 [Hyla sarda]XP_056395755.1 uncharacterized protein LOC130291226 [Hyla sarda]XP_056395756.1 uncharacterized protein LOC130291226 [Hyla sarda]
MTSWNLSLVSALLYLLVAAAAGEPSCDNVEDFGSCANDAGNFCPSGVPCSCKNGKAFCSCPFYRGPNGNYWYLGNKCNQVWSTLDLIVVAVFPGVALAFVVAVTAQLIHFCKTKPPKNKTEKEKKTKSERKTTETHENKSFDPQEGSRSINPDPPQNTERPQSPIPRLNYYSDAPSAGYSEVRPQNQYNGYRGPEPDYPNYEPRGPQYSRFSGPPLPPDDYQQRSPEPYPPNAAWAQRSFHFGRPQVKTYNDY